MILKNTIIYYKNLSDIFQEICDFIFVPGHIKLPYLKKPKRKLPIQIQYFMYALGKYQYLVHMSTYISAKESSHSLITQSNMNQTPVLQLVPVFPLL